MPEILDRLRTALAARYRIQHELGGGGMSTVYLAEDLKHRRNVAIKVLRPDLAAVLGTQRFLQEVEIAAQLTHPHILGLIDSGEADGLLYYVMPYIEGEPLKVKLVREGELPVQDAVRILRDVADALAHAHSRGVIHRDIKPGNVLLSGRHALVTDFGVAKALSEASGRHQLTTAGIALGTPAYMAPEQAAGDPDVDYRADIYAVGALGYELLAGRPPFEGPTPRAVLTAHIAKAPQPLGVLRTGVAPDLEAVIMRCLAKEPADRWQTADELLAQLEALVTPSGGTGAVSAVVPRSRRSTWVAAALAAIVVVLLGLWQPWRAGIPGGAASAARLAVLYLENLSPDTLDAYLADGLTEEITSRVGRIPGIQTKSRNAVRRYRDSLPADLLAVAESLSVDYLLEGSVRRSGEHVRVTVNLVRGSDGFRAWGDDYDREVTDLLTLQEEIAREIAGNIGGRLAPEDLVALGEPAGVIPAAYTSFVRGQGRLTDRSPRSVLRAVQHYRDAVAADPTFARAWARLAYGYALFLDWRWEYPGLTRDSVLALGFSAASRALERDSSLSDGWMARGYLLSFRHPQTFEGVHEAFRRALALDPDNAEAHHQYGWLLMYMGEDEEATAQFERALALEPERTITVFGLGFLTYRLRQMEEAGRWLDSSLTLEPSFAAGYGQRALLALRLGDTAAARADAETGSRLGYVPSDAPLGVLAVQNGDTVRAEALAERLLEHGYIGPTAFVLAALGRPEQALDVLETAELGLEFWTESLRAPELDALRSYPRFERLVREARGVAQR